MKKALLLLMAGIGAWIYFRDPAAPHLVENAALTPTPIKYKTVELNQQKYGYEFLVITSTLDIKLVPNYTEKISVSELIQKHQCKYGVNGGFYSESDRPLGVVIVDGIEISPQISSSLFNGFLSINESGEVQIDRQKFYKDHLALQSGPILILDTVVHDLKLINDKTSRRMVAATTANNDLIFVSVFNPQAEALGPQLDDLPAILKAISDREQLEIQDAINLDGGRASAFYSEKLELPEITWVGALLCIGAPNESM